MRRRRWLLVFGAVVLLLAIGVVWLLLTPLPPEVEQPPPPAAKPPARPLQADAEGTYVPGYRFTLGRYRFAGFTLRPDPYVTFASTSSGTEQALACTEAVIKPDVIHLKCDDPHVGTVTVDGRFLTRVATERLDVAVLSAVVTVRSGSGQLLYSARDSFQWLPADSLQAR